MIRSRALRFALVRAAPIVISLYGSASPAQAPAARLGLDLGAMDPRVRPGDDFERYASGSWLDRAVIPKDYVDTGTFHDVEVRTQDRLRRILEASASKPLTPSMRRVGDFYAAFMDQDEAQARRADETIRLQAVAIRGLVDRESMAEIMGQNQGDLGGSFFNGVFRVDLKNPDLNVVRLEEGGLGLADRQMYLDPQFAKLRSSYESYIAESLALVDWPDPSAAAKATLALETRIAEVSWNAVDSSDRVKMYNPMTVTELESAAPGFPWRSYFNGASLEHVDRFVVGQKTAFPKIAAIYAAAPLDTLRAWQAFHLVDAAAPSLSEQFVENEFKFRGIAEQGIEAQEPRWKRAVAATNDALSDDVGREYVSRYFPPSSKAAMERLTAQLKDAMRVRLEKLTWMSPSTKAIALEKLRNLRVMVGYPNTWRDYSHVKIDRHDLLGNVRRAKAYNWLWGVRQLGKPVDKDQWLEPAQLVDAYSDVYRVAIVFPAAFLQAPIFDPDADPAVNFGAVGAVIGHEITHQFDPTGRKFDPTGHLRDWWTPADATAFESRTAALVAQYDKFRVLPGLFQNGKLSLGENVADIGGLSVALDAYHAWMSRRPAPVIAGLTGDQRLFLGWAQFFRQKSREEVEREVAVSGVHVLPRFRVIGPTRNIDAWYDAFGVVPSDHYYLPPSARVRIW